MVSMTFVILIANHCILTGLSTICDSDKEPFYFLVSMTFVILTGNQIVYLLVFLVFDVWVNNKFTNNKINHHRKGSSIKYSTWH